MNYWYFGIVIAFAIAKDYVWRGHTRHQVNYDPAIPGGMGMFGVLHRFKTKGLTHTHNTHTHTHTHS